ncbi:MarR family winged helix-turn-helix transcriptional regulator [Kiloniella sp. EL199]|uniref:MarR family winged helix-turn-helix transcriptional regulator n=1 Tax=Kiloniella sp. EL199 TaxID=2107581 RepID=UPI000EA29B65|nr:MarR family transcriptional regulator [Kiloniella sp. EL199]
MTDENSIKPDSEILDLKDFFPYKVRVFYRSVSQSIAEVYTKSKGLTVYQWRVMVVLGNSQPLSASEVVDYSSLDKVQVSRAIKGLLEREFIERHVDEIDKRKVNLLLTEKGNDTLQELIPLVLKREQEILDGLSETEKETLEKLMARVLKNADKCFGADKLVEDI